MENPNCPNHGPMKWKEGVSKTTGKSYAFWSCPTKMPDGSWCPTKGPKSAPSQGYAAPAPAIPATNESTELLKSIDAKLAILIELAREKATESVPL